MLFNTLDYALFFAVAFGVYHLLAQRGQNRFLLAASYAFYSAEGQKRVAAHLAPGGVLGVWSAHDSDSFAAVLDLTYPETSREQVRWTVEHDGESEVPLHNVLFFARKG